eukprot:2643224-Rhodomonas_salina.1
MLACVGRVVTWGGGAGRGGCVQGVLRRQRQPPQRLLRRSALASNRLLPPRLRPRPRRGRGRGRGRSLGLGVGVGCWLCRGVCVAVAVGGAVAVWA